MPFNLKQNPDGPIRVTTPLGPDALVLESFEAREAISEPFELTLHCLSLDPAIDMKGLLHKPVCTFLQLSDGSDRYFHGLVRKVVQGAKTQDEVVNYTLEVVPWLWFLNLTNDCRIFQNKTALEIIEQVFKDRGFSDYQIKTSGPIKKRIYCVQYRESDLNFVSRLMEEEGIFYFFEHTDSKHTMVLANANSVIKKCALQDTMVYKSSLSQLSEEDLLIEVWRGQQVHTGKITRTDYDFQKPTNNLMATLSGDQKGEHYDYPGKYETKSEGDSFVKLRLEEREAHFDVLTGASSIRTLQPGFKVKLDEHYRGDTNKEYALLAVEHHAGPMNYLLIKNAPKYGYNNRFDAIPFSVKYRPPLRARRPIVEGEHTAVVVGPPGEEIYTDEYGRIKVHFHWDREGKKDQNDSCWMRVASNWAGSNYGGIFIPRIGWEVVVSFLEGDPDQPLVTGCVYNALQMPPYELPGHKTRSAFKSRSSKGGAASNFNEWRFEDKKGSEQVFLHAEKDMDIRVKKDWRNYAGANYHYIVKGKRVEQVTGDYSLEVKANQKEKIGQSLHQNIGMSHQAKIGMNLHQDVGMNHHEKVGMSYAVDSGLEIHLKAGLNLVIESGVSLTLKVGGSFININPAMIAIQGPMVLINSGGASGSGGGASPQGPAAPDTPDEADDGSKGTKM